MFLFTELTLTYFLPLAKTDMDVWFQYFLKKDALYDVMFFLFFLIVFWKTTGLDKSISSFGVIMSGGSAFDKQIMGINQYLYSDVVLVIIGILISVYIYLRNGRYKNLAS
jgi:hypothetical protein